MVKGGEHRRLWRRLARAREALAGRAMARPLPESAKLPRAARRALRRHSSRAGALPRGGGLWPRCVAPKHGGEEEAVRPQRTAHAREQTRQVVDLVRVRGEG